MAYSASGVARHSYSAPGTPGVESRTFRYAEAVTLNDMLAAGYFLNALEENGGQIRAYSDEVTLQGQNPAPPAPQVAQVSTSGHIDVNGTWQGNP
jgi:hypothetical protein